MAEHNIVLTRLQPHGQTFTEMKDGVFWFSSDKEQPFNVCKDIRHYYVEVPERYHLPLKVDVTAKIDSPAIYIILGAGSVSLTSRKSQLAASAVSDARKRKKDCAKGALNLTVIARNGRNRKDARYINVPNNTAFSFADYVRSFLMIGWLKRSLGIPMSSRT